MNKPILLSEALATRIATFQSDKTMTKPSSSDQAGGKANDYRNRLLVTRRHTKGKEHLASVLNWWLGRSGLSIRRLSALADWACGEDGILIHSQVSHLRNGNIKKPGLTNLDSFYEINVAIYRWQVEGASECHRLYGPHKPFGIDDAWLDDSTWLHHPERHKEPLRFGDWAELAVGLLQLPYVGDLNLSPSEARDLSERLATMLDDLACATGLGIRSGLDAVLAAYPAKDPGRRKKLRAVITGQANYEVDELGIELADIAIAVAALRRKPPKSITASSLHAELMATRRRS
ncbi:hypothetical protein [Cyanobium sp. PCC 7001]|uniref:hypothetical protein n=1 Tax=Cyanobium sp. PCC 7001 TaxID=180281 RepID=UPI0012EAEF1B|nr:hypothetical protein [Cyanobium sp. PCC 7001]